MSKMKGEGRREVKSGFGRSRLLEVKDVKKERRGQEGSKVW